MQAPYPNETLAGALYAFGRVLLAGNLFTGQNVAQYGGAVVLDGNITSCGPSSYTDSSASGNVSFLPALCASSGTLLRCGSSRFWALQRFKHTVFKKC
jgi:hypothetical protein